MANKEMYLFKNEIYNKIREIETKLSTELKNKNSQINTNLTAFNEKVNSILESNKLMIDSITNQKFNFEKIEKLENNKKFINEILSSHKIKLNNIISDIDRIKFRFDKMEKDNIIIPGYVGPGSEYKNIGEFIINTIKEIKKLKEENEQIKKDDKSLRTKVELIMRNMTSMHEYSSNKIREIINLKDNELESLLNNKMKKYEKSLEANNNIFNSQIKLEAKIKEIGDEIGKINDSKTDLNTIISNKFEEINKKEEEMNKKIFNALKEMEEIQKMKDDINEKINNIYLKIDTSKNKYVRTQNKLKTGILKNNINFLGNKLENNKFGSISKKNNIIVNSFNNVLSPNNANKYKSEKKTIFSIRHQSKKDLIINSNQNFLSDKKNVLKENNFTTAKNLKMEDIINEFNKEKEKEKEKEIEKENENINVNEKVKEKEKEKEIKFESPLINSLKNNNSINAGKNIREKILENNIINLKIDKNDTNINYENGNKNILTNIGIQNLIKGNKKPNKPILKLINTGYTKTNPENILTLSDNDELKRAKTIYNINNKKKVKYKNENEESDNNLMNKNIPTITRNIKIVDCNLVNLNLIDIPNINETNSNSSSNDDLLYKHSIKKRKIKSVDSKRPLKLTNLEKNNNNIIFNSSKGIYRFKK